VDDLISRNAKPFNGKPGPQCNGADCEPMFRCAPSDPNCNLHPKFWDGKTPPPPPYLRIPTAAPTPAPTEAPTPAPTAAPTIATCTCTPCGQSYPFNYGGGSCGVATSTCSESAGTADQGCYSSSDASCDCGTLTPTPNTCTCIPCGSSTAVSYGTGVCGAESSTCSPSASGPGCYSSNFGPCDCQTLLTKAMAIADFCTCTGVANQMRCSSAGIRYCAVGMKCSGPGNLFGNWTMCTV